MSLGGLPPRAASAGSGEPSPSASEESWARGFLQVTDGALIHYGHRGDGPSVLLCDGIGCEGFAWRYIAPALAAHHLVIHPHLRGHGRSPAPPDPSRVSIEILADDAIEVLAALDGEDAILIGHSMGVQICLEAYRRHPDRVRGLVLTCGSYGSPLRSLFGVDVFHYLMPLLRLLLLGGRHPFRLLWRTLLPTDLAYELALALEVNGQLIDRRDMVGYLEHLSRVEPDLFLRMLTFADQHSARDLLDHLRVPVLVVGGRRDGFTPIALAQEMASRIPGAQFLEIPDGTHAAPLERPELVTAAVVRFAEEVSGR